MLRRATALKRICDRQRVQNALFTNFENASRQNMSKILKTVYGINNLANFFFTIYVYDLF